MKILLADDDVDSLDVTTYALRKYGYDVVTVTDGQNAVRRWEDERPDLVLLDVGLPRLNGFEVCRTIRQASSTPVIMVTGKTDEENVVQGFLNGADDYVTKPFSQRQLAMRIRAVLGRTSAGMPSEPAGQLKTADISLDLQSHEAIRLGVATRLTPLEFRLMYILMTNEGRVVSSNRLVEHAWGYDGGEAVLLKTHVCHIRQKLSMKEGQGSYIKAIPWVGYMLTRP